MREEEDSSSLRRRCCPVEPRGGRRVPHRAPSSCTALAKLVGGPQQPPSSSGQLTACLSNRRLI